MTTFTTALDSSYFSQSESFTPPATTKILPGVLAFAFETSIIR
jgi:hypothetical protein